MKPVNSRFEFLSLALRSYESGDAETLLNLANEFLVERTAGEVEDLSDEDNRVLNEMEAELNKARGEFLSIQKLSLATHEKPDTSSIMLDNLKRLSPEGRDIMIKAYGEVLRNLQEHEREHHDAGGSEWDVLEARYARELIELLPSIVRKASSLQSLAIGRIPKPSVQRYFEEVHKCYFFGLNKSCVILCRAVLEAALKDALGANHRTHELLEQAGRPRVDGHPPKLDAERLDAAERIFSAGDSAVHHEKIFAKNYADSDIEKFLIDTRKILEDLYSGSARANNSHSPQA